MSEEAEQTRRCDCGWYTCMLCRSGRQSLSTLERALTRKVVWPHQEMTPPEFKEPSTYTSIDDAFDSVLQLMTTTTRQCKRYHRCQKKDRKSADDIYHFQRFHVKQKPAVLDRNPLQKPEDVRIEVAPGTYAVTAGRWGAERDHTHVVHVAPGQTVDLTFGV